MDNARAYLEFLAQGSTQLLMYDAEPGYVPAASDIDVPKLDRLGAKSWQLVERAQRITNYLDRDTNPNWAAGKLLGDFFARFLHGPPGDLSVLQGQIQRFWDVLGTYAEH
jgi:multiple sugar transport system substrate-binding protein